MNIIINLDHTIKISGKHCERRCQYFKTGVGMGNEWERCLLFDQPWVILYRDLNGTKRCRQCLEKTADV